MGLENFIPTIWSAKLFVRLRKALVFSSLVNTDYEGEIREFGDRVKINELGPVTVSDYARYGTLSWQELSSAQKELVIDQASSFSFKIDDIDRAQQNPKLMNAAMDEAAYAIADTIDTFLAKFYTQAGITNATNMGTATTSIAVSSGNVIKVLSFSSRYMDERNVPSGNRTMTITPLLHQKLLLAEVGGISATAVPKVFDDGTLTSGYIGDALGFRMVMSNNVQDVATGATVVSAIMAFNRTAISYAGQITQIKAVDLQDSFGQGVKGLYVYGGKVVRPDALACLYLREVAG
jgi:hypothetical protein